ncbi:MAG: protein kinase [Nitrospirae bacterium]|nr:protein kinase [Nitrospirota bacterium]
MEDITINIPEKLGKFDIVKEIGRGSMAVVYLGYDPFMNRNVAIKVALPKILKDKKMGSIFEKMFFKEAHITGMLNNRFLLPVYDAGICNDMMYIVMEYIKGGKTVKNPAAETAGRQTAKEDTLWQRPQGVLLNLKLTDFLRTSSTPR